MTNPNEQTDEDVQKVLAGESVRGLRSFGGKPLADLTSGLRDLWLKVLMPDDSDRFAHYSLIHILLAAQSDGPDDKRAKRRQLMAETDDRLGYRTMINLAIDDLSDDQHREARDVFNDLFGIIEKAEAVIAEKKSSGSADAAPSQTETPS